MNRNKFVEYERPQIVGSNAKGKRDAASARKINNDIQHNLIEKRKRWQILPPENMTLVLHKDAGAFPSGLVLSVPHEVGRWLLHKHRHRCSIVEHDVSIDAVIEGSFEDAIEALGWQQQHESSEHCG